MNMDMNNYEEMKKFFEELFKDENILEAMKNTTIVPEHPPEWLYTFAEFNPPQVSEDEMKAAFVRMSIMDCSGPDRMGRIYSKEAIAKAWREWFNKFGGDSMLVKGIIDEDFINYKKPSMFINFPSCSFKCDKECGKPVCQNSSLATAPTFEIDYDEIIDRYLNNPITEAIVCGGLEPFDDFLYLFDFIQRFRQKSKDDIVIYTGYYPEEIKGKLYKLWLFDGRDNIIIKFGRFIPDSSPVYDELLGVDLASCNQKAMRLEDCINGSD